MRNTRRLVTLGRALIKQVQVRPAFLERVAWLSDSVKMSGGTANEAAAEVERGPGWGAVAGGEGQVVWAPAAGAAGMEVIPPLRVHPFILEPKVDESCSSSVCHAVAPLRFSVVAFHRAGGRRALKQRFADQWYRAAAILHTAALLSEIPDTIPRGGALVSAKQRFDKSSRALAWIETFAWIDTSIFFSNQTPYRCTGGRRRRSEPII
ncbi:hypothetical protein T484DRAFT_1750173 [Baffinella frigidus]|nr:hypothetical protein T484DRAFT_1750173 [Cryptophyta sp. CCMP2293]